MSEAIMPCPLRPCACSVVAASLHAGAVRGGMEDSLPSEGVVLIEASPSQGSLSDEGEGELEDDSAWPAPAEERQQRGRGTPWSGVADGWGGAGLRREHGRESAALSEEEELEAELSTVLEEGSSEQMTVGSNVATSILTELVDSAVSRVQEPEPAQEAHHRGDSPNLQDWLADVGAAEYYQSFIQEGFEDLASVLQSRLTEDDLRELGMVAMAPRKRVFHALADATLAAAADPAPPHGSELGLTAAVQQLLAALEPAVPAMLAQLQRLDPDGAATAAVSNAVAAAPVRTRGLLPQHVARRPVVADLAAATAAKSSRHNSSARSRPSTAAVHPSTTPAAGQFSIGGADLAIFSRDAPLAAAAVAAAKPRAPSPQAAKPQPPKTVDEPTAGVDAFPKTSGQVVKELSAEEFSERLHAELRANLASAAGEAVRVAASASADAQDAAELADEIRTAVLAWRARTDPYQNAMRLLRDLLAEYDEGVLSYGRPNGLISAASLLDLFSERLGLFLTTEETMVLCAAQPSPPPRRRLANKHLVHGNDAGGPDGYALDYNSFARRLFPQTEASRRRRRQQQEQEQQHGYLGRHVARSRKHPPNIDGPTKER